MRTGPANRSTKPIFLRWLSVCALALLTAACTVDGDEDIPSDGADTASEVGDTAGTFDADTSGGDDALVDTVSDTDRVDDAAGDPTDGSDAADADPETTDAVADADDATDAEVSGDGSSPGDAEVDPSSDAGDAAADPDTGPWIRIGGGARFFEVYEDGDVARLTAGRQGGHHIWGGFEGDGFNPVGVNHFYEIIFEGEVVGATSWTGNIPRVGERFAIAGVTVVLGFEVTPEELDGETVTLRVAVTDSDGIVLNDEVELVADCCEGL